MTSQLTSEEIKSKSSKIHIWNRIRGRLDEEKVYGDLGVRFLYKTKIGQLLSEYIFSKSFFSKLLGAYYSSSFSKSKIKPFVDYFNIPMEDYQIKDFESFNSFFIRQFKPGLREYPVKTSQMGAPAEGRYIAYDQITADQRFPVKGKDLTPEMVLGSKETAKPFIGGPCMIARLCPVDYHRFHYPDAGKIHSFYRVHGNLHSVNPLALQYRSDIFATNERQVSILETENFGLLAYVEIGASGVGKIIQSHPHDQLFKRGQEKGYFLFGGSTVILFGEPGKWTIDSDITSKTKEGTEVLIRLGEGIAKAQMV